MREDMAATEGSSLNPKDTYKTKREKSVIRENIEAILIALLIAIVVRTFAVQAFKIPSGSMLETLQIGDHILVNKIVFGTPIDIPFTDINLFWMPGLYKPQRNDIIVFKYPEDPKRDFIKRTVAVGGDVVEGRDKVLYVNGRQVDEPFAIRKDDMIKPGSMDKRDNFGPYTIPEGKVFVMGDNRDQSYDSRFWGPVDLKKIKGKAVIIYWSWDTSKKWNHLNRIGRLVK
ncbi:MAG: signal peptidase I [Nitrospirae bacterium]|nr:signal peptidase I [Nitrospirota bacterium]